MGKRELAPKMARVEEKDQMSEIPLDILREFLLDAYKEGSFKYQKGSWRRGFTVSELIDAAERHLERFSRSCEDFDPESLEKFGIMKHHLAGSIFSMIAILHTLKYGPDLDDRLKPEDGSPLRSEIDVAEILKIGYKEFERQQMVIKNDSNR